MSKQKRDQRIATLVCVAMIAAGSLMGLIWTILNRPVS